MSLLKFLIRAHRRTVGGPVPGLRDPLHAIGSLIRANPASPRARVLLRVLIAFRDNAGEFAESDAWALDAEAQWLLSVLVNDYLAGRYPEAEFAAVVQALENLGEPKTD